MKIYYITNTEIETRSEYQYRELIEGSYNCKDPNVV